MPSCSYDAFLGEFKRTFAHPISVGSAVRRLLNLRQGRRSIADYLIDFRTAAAAVGWPDKALQGVYSQSLNEDMKDQLASRDEPVTFEELATLTLRLDNRLRERERERNSSTRRPVRRASPVYIPRHRFRFCRRPQSLGRGLTRNRNPCSSGDPGCLRKRGRGVIALAHVFIVVPRSISFPPVQRREKGTPAGRSGDTGGRYL